MIHAASIPYSYATSGSLLWALGTSLPWSIYAAVVVWRGQGRRKAERSRGILGSVLLYTTPVLARGDFRNYGCALGSFAFAGAVYQLHSFFGGKPDASCPIMIIVNFIGALGASKISNA